jgi:hypothetical protein
VLWGSPEKVPVRLLAFDGDAGRFGKLLYPGKDWLDCDLAANR